MFISLFWLESMSGRLSFILVICLLDRVQVRPSCLKAPGPSKEQGMVNGEVELSTQDKSGDVVCTSGSMLHNGSCSFQDTHGKEILAGNSLEAVKENVMEVCIATSELVFSTSRDVPRFDKAVCTEQEANTNVNGFESCPSVSNGSFEVSGVGISLGTLREDPKDVIRDDPMDVDVVELANHEPCQAVLKERSQCYSKDLSVPNGYVIKEDSEDTCMADSDSSLNIRDIAICCNRHAHTDEIASQVNSDAFSLSRGTVSS